MDRYFPDLLEPLAAALPERAVVDGEIVIVGPDGLDFDALLLLATGQRYADQDDGRSSRKNVAAKFPPGYYAPLKRCSSRERAQALAGEAPDQDPHGTAPRDEPGRVHLGADQQERRREGEQDGGQVHQGRPPELPGDAGHERDRRGVHPVEQGP